MKPRLGIAALIVSALIFNTAAETRPLLVPQKSPFVMQVHESVTIPKDTIPVDTTASPLALSNGNVVVLMVSVAALTAAGSVVLIVLASLARLAISFRSFAAAITVAVASVILEALGFQRRTTFVGRTISEVGQALSIAASGWSFFSAMWHSVYGAVQTPGCKPLLNACAVVGCTACAAAFARVRPASRAQTSVPFAAALMMLHLHLLVTPDLEVPKLAPMAICSSAFVLSALGLDVLAQRAAYAGREAVRGGDERREAQHGVGGLDGSVGGHAPDSGGRCGGRWARVRGTEDMILSGVIVNLIWTGLTLGKWSFSRAPTWGFAAIAASLSITQLALGAAHGALPHAAQPARAYFHTFEQGWYMRLANWLALLGAWRTFSPDEHSSSGLSAEPGKRERHFFSLLGAFTFWGLTSAASGRHVSSVLAMIMVLSVVFKTAVASLFGEPLLMAGLLGLTGGTAMLWFMARFVSDAKLD